MKLNRRIAEWWYTGDTTPSERLGTYQDRLQAAVARRQLPDRLLHDLKATGLVQREHYGVRAPVVDPGCPGERMVAIEINGRVATLIPWIDNAEGVVSIAAHLLQEVVEEDTAPWPRCPEHDHSLHATTVGKVWPRAYWACPSDDALRWPVGSLS
jgi:hypothetical protein